MFVSLQGSFLNPQRCCIFIVICHCPPFAEVAVAGAQLLRFSPGKDEQLTLIKTHRFERFKEGRWEKCGDADKIRMDLWESSARTRRWRE